MAIYKCLFCKNKYSNKSSLYTHIEKEHDELIPKDISISRFYFNVRNKKENGKCVICGNITQWNEGSERYDRFCSDICKDIYVKEMKNRMINKYGKAHLLNDMDTQKKMLNNRSISGKYNWSDNIHKIQYVGSYELDFLKFMDHFMKWSPNDILECPFSIEYIYDGKQLMYIPDFFIPSLNLVVEIKDGGDNPNTHHKIQSIDKEKEKQKEKALLNQKKYNYIKLTDKKYSIFIEYLINLKNTHIEKNDKDITPIFMLGESFDVILENIKINI